MENKFFKNWVINDLIVCEKEKNDWVLFNYLNGKVKEKCFYCGLNIRSNVYIYNRVNKLQLMFDYFNKKNFDL